MDAPRIVGNLLPNYIGKTVILLGKIDKKSSDGRCAQLRTVDNVPVNISLAEPIDGNEEGYVEAEGTLKSKNTLACTRLTYYNLPSEKFDPQIYEHMVTLYHLFGTTIFERWD